jgi:hypothetical protein
MLAPSGKERCNRQGTDRPARPQMRVLAHRQRGMPNLADAGLPRLPCTVGKALLAGLSPGGRAGAALSGVDVRRVAR